MLGEPRKFFAELPEETEWIQPIGVLFVSSLLFTGASIIVGMPRNPFLSAVILLVNAMGMVVITAGLGYIVMIVTQKKPEPFSRFFSIYAYASGAMLLIAWMPYFIWLTEPWRWWLIGNGLVKGCGLKVKEAILIIGLSLAIVILLFWLLISLFAYQ